MILSELKFIVTGTPGVGKSTAMSTISDIGPVVTDEVVIDGLTALQEASTVAFDVGELLLDNETIVRIYGTPGQERFRNRWEKLAQDALGLIILLDDTRTDPVYDLGIYIENFSELIHQTSVVVGVTKIDDSDVAALDKYCDWLTLRNIYCPVIAVDPRRERDMAALMEALISMLEFA